jgi:hypothetical protein
MDAIVALAPPDAERHCVGRAPGRRALRQDEVNARLIELLGAAAADDGVRVVALWGAGGAFLFDAVTFAVSAVCLLLYHVQWFVFAVYGINEQNAENVYGMAAFFNLFVALGAVCSIIGFMRMNDPRTKRMGGDEID